MHGDALSRRDFHRLSTAALGGLVAGALAGCNDQSEKPNTKVDKSPTKAETADTKASPGAAVAATTVALHACHGLNECKTQGKDHKNDCAGKGSCFTVTHDCSGKNDCKFQGGCGGENGLNECKGKGGCGHFPIADDAIWKKARIAFVSRMTKAGKKTGPAPAATS